MVTHLKIMIIESLNNDYFFLYIETKIMFFFLSEEDFGSKVDNI